MAKGKRIYVLTNQIKNKIIKESTTTMRKHIAGRVFFIRGKLRSIHCRLCSQEIDVGEVVVSSRAKRRQNIYHVKCAASVNLL
jgi:hypothetical protein